MADTKPLIDLDDDPPSSSSSSFPLPCSHTTVPATTHAPHATPSSYSPKYTPEFVENSLRISYAQAFDNLRLDKHNLSCFDCGNNQTSWVSLHHGIFICLKCAGEHRGLGVHVSVVRSINLDTWSHERLIYMLIGGNLRAREFFAHKDPTLLSAPIPQKYTSQVAEEYRKHLRAEYDSLLQSLERKGVVKPALQQSSEISPPPPNMRKFAGATSISSDQLFGETKKKKSRVCCC
eukprot:Phypoly_transcript_16748.p1 GENE.Phypoly_transcript_16748~~Phypoly_transcript_16748.p1  ORF type:complete len:264 (+),score=36.94 Phypoly_transcript_16748:93-794(+)